jgi:hypothetical protein
MFCIQCGIALPGGARFCPECGSAVSEPPKNDEVMSRETAPAIRASTVSSGRKHTGGENTEPVQEKGALWKKVLVGMVLLIAGLVGLAVLVTADLLVPVEAHLDALRNGEIQRAYSQTTAAFQAATPLSDYQQFVVAYPELQEHQGFTVESRGFEGSEGRVMGFLNYGDTKLAKIEFLLLEEGDHWKIQGFELSSPE